MATITLTRHLQRFIPSLPQGSFQMEVDTVSKLIDALDQRYKGLRGYLVDETGALRQHVNIFIGDEQVRDRLHLSDALTPESQVMIFQSLSGG